MFRTHLMTAAAAAALFAAPAAFAQDAMSPTPQDPAPTQPATATAQPAPAAPQAQPSATPAIANNLIDVLKADGRFTTLLSAIEQAQLTNVLSTTPAISIFAPTDEAFAALPEADRTRLMDPANAEELRDLLLYHVIVADVSSSQITGALGPVETAAGNRVQLDGTGDAIKIDQATVVQADIDAGNGAIFAIDTVLNPANSQAAMGDEETSPTADTAPAQTPPAETPPAEVDETAPVTETVPAETAPVPAPVEETTPVTETMPSEAAPAPVPSEEAAPVPTEEPATETPPVDEETPADPQ
ncbi:fasciclin domain-containing protein [Brevundimonas sp.]|uniref:fasciclin domain-containing protein n=1 Tax=Brevundimonas sp. TaxID=1871086 RepID=UPI002ABB83F5|nr:fasciclin domain-containing protein [Brevundimonas sp.]MDZ4363068.1 fasciclin domain-containing protein [Brevundimonas sp.]